jgi:hypothetical protein
MQKYNSVGISIPTDILLIIDKERGDISRSRYILRILQKHSQQTTSVTVKVVKICVGDIRYVNDFGQILGNSGVKDLLKNTGTSN